MKNSNHPNVNQELVRDCVDTIKNSFENFIGKHDMNRDTFMACVLDSMQGILAGALGKSVDELLTMMPETEEIINKESNNEK